MSTRPSRKKKKRNDPDLTRIQQKHPNKWTVEDKKNLLRAIKQYGHTDITGIAAMMNNKSPTSIKLIIHKIMQKARVKSSSLPCTTLETWLNSGMFDDTSSPIAQAFKLISMFEKHPPPEESNGFDFGQVYDYLHRIILGNPRMEISEETLLKLKSLMDEVHNEVWPAAENDVVGYLGTLNRRKLALQCYPPMSKLESRRIIGPDQD
ncbi:uncharacterized protein [Venturia canescens]|uniref:uncharacterized protein n=1 Tax=Venturia canescens TaxID=32260 RepID=UPI001C9D4A59|nr:uncharacterized protein LOC122407466 [Venturia canescens]XP_043269633.1 uncharacterized protein LOC122407466 [Venturia canescens]